MVSLSDIQSSNAQIATSLPPGLVAVFVGATSGIGETALKEFARYTRQPRVYFIGRSQEAGARITAECRQLNPNGEFTFIKADVSLLQVVDNVCREIKNKEKAINLLFLTCGTANIHTDTSEGVHVLTAVAYYARMRFTVNLLPLLERATDLRRVVTVLAGGKEGRINTQDFQGRETSMLALRGQMTSMTDLALETLAQQYPGVSFVHDYPGAVKSGLAREANSILVYIAGIILFFIGPLVYIPNKECGERHLFFATSAKYPPREGEAASGVPVPNEVKVAQGTDGNVHSGVYSVHWDGESAGPKVVKLLTKLRQEGMAEQVRKHTMGEFKRITGSEALA